MQFKRAYVLLATCLSVVSTLASAQIPNSNQAPTPFVYISNLSCSQAPFGLRLPATFPELLKLGKVVQEKSEEPQKWDDYSTTKKLVEFAGFKLQLITFSNDALRYLVTAAEISDAKWNIAGPFRVGASVAATRQLLGKLAEGDPKLDSTYAGDGDVIRFEQQDGKITKIFYACYSG